MADDKKKTSRVRINLGERTPKAPTTTPATPAKKTSRVRINPRSK